METLENSESETSVKPKKVRDVDDTLGLGELVNGTYLKPKKVRDFDYTLGLGGSSV